MSDILDHGWLPAHIAADVLVRTGRGILHSVVVNGLTTAGDCTIFDGTDATGTVIAVLHLDPTTSISVQPITFLYDCRFNTGLFFDYDATLAADLTAMYL